MIYSLGRKDRELGKSIHFQGFKK